MTEFKPPYLLQGNSEDDEIDPLEASRPADALCLNEALEHEVGRVQFVFADRDKERPIFFMAASLDAELDTLYDAVTETRDYSSFVARMIGKNGNVIREKKVGSDYLEWIYNKPIKVIIDAIRADDQISL